MTKKIKYILFLLSSILVIICINIAHNSSDVSIGGFFSMSHYDSNTVLTEKYIDELSALNITEVTYFKPIWYWSYVVHSKLTVSQVNDKELGFSGKFWGDKDPIYAKIKIEGDRLFFYRLGGFRIKNTKKEQLALGESLIQRILLNVSIKNKIEDN